MKKITLCADDYGLSPGISDAILQLLNRQRLSAVSCMVNGPRWHDHANALQAFSGVVDIGLHFSLTDIPPKTTKICKHPHIILQAYGKQLCESVIEEELTTQINRFEDAIGKLPDFIDGHQHIHQLPVVRDSLLSVYKKRLSHQPCYIRIPITSPLTPKSTIIALTGAFQLRKQLKQRGIPYNTSFSGVYHFKDAINYPQHFQGFLKNIRPDGLIMCHPGLNSKNNQNDVIATARQYEFDYLNSQRFITDCQAHSAIMKPLLSN
jgi:chitin disaccharide deacetylase